MNADQVATALRARYKPAEWLVGADRLAREALRAAEAAREHCGVRYTVDWDEPKRHAVGDAMFVALDLSSGRKVRRAAQVAAQAADDGVAWKALDAAWRASVAAALVAGWDGESAARSDDEGLPLGRAADDALRPTALGLRVEADALRNRMVSLWALNLK